jgi:hypothetical protein
LGFFFRHRLFRLRTHELPGFLKTEGARTQRTLPRGTAKRLSNEHAKPRPMGRVLGRSFDGLGKLAVFEAARSRSYAK